MVRISMVLANHSVKTVHHHHHHHTYAYMFYPLSTLVEMLITVVLVYKYLHLYVAGSMEASVLKILENFKANKYGEIRRRF